ncbi:MAG: hypothetical protein J7539_04945 [Niabella sp.]|nr:hypothetical protein [Niabella sp.]
MSIKINIIILFMLLIVSCKQINKSFEDTIHPKPVKNLQAQDDDYTGGSDEKHYRGIFESAERLDRIQAELQNLPQFKGKQLQLYQSMHFYDYKDGYISINIQNPDTTENIDNYKYEDGKWKEPVPVKISGTTDLVGYLMPLDQIRFSIAKKVHDQTMEKLKEVRGTKKVEFVYFSYVKSNVPAITPSTWYTNIEGLRNDYMLNFDNNGDLTEMKPR